MGRGEVEGAVDDFEGEEGLDGWVTAFSSRALRRRRVGADEGGGIEAGRTIKESDAFVGGLSDDGVEKWVLVIIMALCALMSCWTAMSVSSSWRWTAWGSVRHLALAKQRNWHKPSVVVQ